MTQELITSFNMQTFVIIAVALGAGVLEAKKLTKSQLSEFKNITQNQPVFSGNLQSHQGAKELIDLGYVKRENGKYSLTEKGEKIRMKICSCGNIGKSPLCKKCFENGLKYPEIKVGNTVRHKETGCWGRVNSISEGFVYFSAKNYFAQTHELEIID